jgi:hypothetical protein
MSDQASDKQQRRYRRQRHMLDWRLQLAIAAQLLGVLAGVGMLYTIGLFVLPGSEGLADLSATELRSVLLRANGIYFALGGSILGVIAILLTHRFVGPALVLRRAVEAMRKGDFGARLALRKRDYLKPLAASIESLRVALLSSQETRNRALEDLERCLREGDLAAARELIVRLKGEVAEKKVEEPAPATAEPEAARR